jgi:hypothetical protein
VLFRARPRGGRRSLWSAATPKGGGAGPPASEAVVANRLLASLAKSRLATLNASSCVGLRSGVHPDGGARRGVCAGRSRPDAPARSRRSAAPGESVVTGTLPSSAEGCVEARSPVPERGAAAGVVCQGRRSAQGPGGGGTGKSVRRTSRARRRRRGRRFARRSNSPQREFANSAAARGTELTGVVYRAC